MPEHQLRIAVDERRAVTAVRTEPEGRPQHAVFAYAPGASGRKREDVWSEAVEAALAWLRKARVIT